MSDPQIPVNASNQSPTPVLGDGLTSLPSSTNAQTLQPTSSGGTLTDGSVTTAILADGAVTTPKIEDLAVTGPKITSNAIIAGRVFTGADSTGGPTDVTISGPAIPVGSLVLFAFATDGVNVLASPFGFPSWATFFTSAVAAGNKLTQTAGNDFTAYTFQLIILSR